MSLVESVKSSVKSITGINRRLQLTEHQRRWIVNFFGSFRANAMALNQRNFIDEGYERNIDVYSLIRKVVDSSKNGRWVVEERVAGTSNEWVELEGTSLHELMANPNVPKQYTWDDIIEQTIIYLLAGGNGILIGLSGSLTGGGTIDEIDILPNRHVTIKTTGDWHDPIDRYVFKIDGTKETFEKEEVQHFRLFNPGYSSIRDMVWGLSPVAVAARAVQVGNDRWDADAALLQNRGAIGMITDRSNRPMTPTQAQQVQDEFQFDTSGPHNFGKIKVTNKDLAFIQMAMSSTDLQLIEKGVVTLRSICNVLGLDSSLFNDPANKTFNNRDSADKAKYNDAVMPLNEKLAIGFTRWLVPSHFPGKEGRIRMRNDFSNVAVLQDDLNEKAKTFSLMKTSGIISANTAAQALGQPLSDDPNADKLIVSSNNILLETLNPSEDGNEN